MRVRYPQELRDNPERLANVLIPVAQGASVSAGGAMGAGSGGMGAGGGMAAGRAPQVPLGQVATIREVPGPMVVRTEDAIPTAWVYVDVVGRDIYNPYALSEAVAWLKRLRLEIGTLGEPKRCSVGITWCDPARRNRRS